MIYNLDGRRIDTLMNQELKAGHHRIVWDAGRLDSGVYIYHILADDLGASGKCILLK